MEMNHYTKKVKLPEQKSEQWIQFGSKFLSHFCNILKSEGILDIWILDLAGFRTKCFINQVMNDV